MIIIIMTFIIAQYSHDFLQDYLTSFTLLKSLIHLKDYQGMVSGLAKLVQFLNFCEKFLSFWEFFSFVTLDWIFNF